MKRQAGDLVETADLVQYVSGPVEGKLADWPQQMQDAVHMALERLNGPRLGTNLAPFQIEQVRCDFDHDEGKWFVQVVAQAITRAPGEKTC